MTVIKAAVMCFLGFCFAVAVKPDDPFIPMLFGAMIFGLIGIAIIDLGWLDRFLRWIK